MPEDQRTWLLQIGKRLRERGERAGMQVHLPKAVQAALDRLASSERVREEQDERERRRG